MTKNLDWANIGFGYIKTDYRFVANYKDGKWDEGTLTTDENIVLNECAGVLQYAQTCFEGMKAYRTIDGKVVCFRPDLNAKRMADTARRLVMPAFPEDKFVEAVLKTIKANIDWVPPYGTGAALYLRPFMFGSGIVIGVKPATECQLRIFATPVGSYFKGGINGVALRVPDYDRAAPRGTGHVKAGLNYAMSLQPVHEAHQLGYAENLYLDSATRTNVEETGGANVIFVTKENTVVTPKSGTILPSVTRRSLMYVAEHYLGLKVEERVIPYSEVKEFKECALCGTAAVLSPVGRIDNNGESVYFDYNNQGMGEITKKLYDTLTGIQMGKIEAPEGWIRVVE